MSLAASHHSPFRHDFKLESFYDNLKTFKLSFRVAFCGFDVSEAHLGLRAEKTLITAITWKFSIESRCAGCS